MAPRVPVIAALVLPLLCLAAACAAKRATMAPPPSDLRDFYPMEVGNAWSYDVDTGEGTTTLAVTTVESVDGLIVALRTARTIIRYEATADGIRAAGADAWLLRAPLRVGATWPAPGGRGAELLSSGMTVETSAGAFDRCIEVLEVGGKLELEVRTVYCAGVGPVIVSSTMRSNTADRRLTVSARLRGYRVNPTRPRNR